MSTATRKVKDVAIGTKLNVRIVPVLNDNYSYILWKQQQQQAIKKLAVIDVSNDYEPVLRECRALLQQQQGDAFPQGSIEVFTTHRHFDHQGGNPHLAKLIPNLRIVGGEHEPISGKTEDAKEQFEGTLKFDTDICVDTLFVPYHTRGHVLFNFYHPEEKATAGACFTGDAIFYAGCGAVNTGGTTAELISCFRKAAARLSPKTSLFCGHNYLANFIGYAQKLQPNNKDIERVVAQCQQNNAAGQPNVPSTVEDELKVNPFMKVALGDKEFIEGAVPEGKDRTSQETAMEWVYNNCP